MAAPVPATGRTINLAAAAPPARFLALWAVLQLGGWLLLAAMLGLAWSSGLHAAVWALLGGMGAHGAAAGMLGARWRGSWRRFGVIVGATSAALLTLGMLVNLEGFVFAGGVLLAASLLAGAALARLTGGCR